MNARRIVLAVSLLLGVLAVALQCERNSRDPLFRGKRLSVWIREFDIWQRPSTSAAETLENSGKSAQELLMEMLRSRDSKLKLKLRELLSKQTWIKVSFASVASFHEQALNICKTPICYAAFVMEFRAESAFNHPVILDHRHG